MTNIPCWQIDAVADRPFGGNPAAVCWLEQEAEADGMQSAAAEMNLSETAFVRKLAGGVDLRWFTPTAELDLSGLATLASAHAIWSNGYVPADEANPFHTPTG